MQLTPPFNHRNGLDLLTSPRFRPAFEEFVAVLRALPPFRAPVATKSAPAFVIAPAAMNAWLDYELCVRRDWAWHPRIDDTEGDDATHLCSDFRRDRIEVEVQLSNVARYAYDLYKMAMAHALERSDVGLLVVATRRFGTIIGDNLASYERIVRELGRSRLTVNIPLVVVGIEPEHWRVEDYPLATTAPRPRRRDGRQLWLADGRG